MTEFERKVLEFLEFRKKDLQRSNWPLYIMMIVWLVLVAVEFLCGL